MKLKLIALLILGAAAFSSCQKKQCPAYTQVDIEKSKEANV